MIILCYHICSHDTSMPLGGEVSVSIITLCNIELLVIGSIMVL